MTGGEMTETGYTLRELVERVHEARTRAATAREDWDSTLRDLERLHEPEIAAVRNSREDVAARELDLRLAAIQAYNESGNKAPAPGVAIKMVTRVEFSEVEANAWGLEHKMFIRLDARSFEAFAKKSPDQVPFVHVQQEPTATIATNLAAALGGE